MASSYSPLRMEEQDQTDEDFFDKLVDDEFDAAAESHSAAAKDTARDFSNLSLGDVGTSLENSGDSVFVSEVESNHQASTLQASEDAPVSTASLEDKSSVLRGSSNLKDVQLERPVGSNAESGSLGSLVAKGSGSKGTSVKDVQWSAFSINGQEFSQGGFGSYSDFLAEENSFSKPNDDSDLNQHFVDKQFETQSSDGGLLDQQDAQVFGSSTEQATTNVNDVQYWENLYPGWKYDLSTGQWYQIDNSDTTTDSQWANYNTTSENSNGMYGENAHSTADGSFSVNPDVSYLQQSSQSVLETIAEENAVNTVSNWNDDAQGSTGYPANMVFDPQYPGWYYDTNSQHWYTLESYTQAMELSSGTFQDQVSANLNASDGFLENQNLSNEVGQPEKHIMQDQGIQEHGGGWNSFVGNFNQQNLWQPEAVHSNKLVEGFSGNKLTGSFYASVGHSGSHTQEQTGFKAFEPVTSYNYGSVNGMAGPQSFVPAENKHHSQQNWEQNAQVHLSNSYYGSQNAMNYSQQPFESINASYSNFNYTPQEARSSAGRPPHALVAFGFGGKLIVTKDTGTTKFDYGNQATSSSTISILSLSDIVVDKTDGSSNVNGGTFSYFHSLCQQSFPGPLVGGNAATKDVNKWLDERIVSCESSNSEFQRQDPLKLLISLLKILCQHYGRIRSPFVSDPSLEEAGSPEMAVTKLFASAKSNRTYLRNCGSYNHCMQNLPSESEIRAAALEVQNLLVSGRRREALELAEEAHLWGPALVLAAQLGDQFYVDTVKKMAHRQFTCGSPLRTLCLLIAGQPADVFAVDSRTNNLYGAFNASQQPMEAQGSGMLDDWEENLAIITANRTKDDELVMVHLGDCLWKEKGEVTAAHTCYLVAEANFESYSDSARLCLIGADHWKCPRTFASPEAIQRTELYEFAKVLGNSQFILLPLQPYKLIYAHMLAEVGKVSDSLRYCQASLKLLKSSGRAPELETWKSLFSSLEERLRTHQQGGYNTNLAPGKLVGKLFNSLDRSIHRMIGAPPSPLPPLPQGSVNEKDSNHAASKVANSQYALVNSQSAMAMASLMPSPSVESISDWTVDNSRRIIHNRSISEPDFGRSPKQNAGPDGAQGNGPASGRSRFGWIGSQFLQKTVGWVSRSHHQAKLGESNKFYYDEKLKRWVEEGAETLAEEPPLPPPPTTTSFQNGMPDYNINNAVKNENHLANGVLETKPAILSEHGSGSPPIPPSQNQFSARGRMAVRSRYVDTFNKGDGTATNLFQSPAVPSVKPAATSAKFFVPTAPASFPDEQKVDEAAGINPSTTNLEDPSLSVSKEPPFSPPSSLSSSIQRHPSMDNTTPYGSKGSGMASGSSNGPLSRTRAASWSGTHTDALNGRTGEMKPVLDGQMVPSWFIPGHPSHTRSSSSSSLQLNGSSLAEDLHEVEL